MGTQPLSVGQARNDKYRGSPRPVSWPGRAHGRSRSQGAAAVGRSQQRLRHRTAHRTIRRVSALMVLGGDLLHRPSGEQRLPAAHPPQDLAAGITCYSRCSRRSSRTSAASCRCRGLCWSGLMPRAMERRHESARSLGISGRGTPEMTSSWARRTALTWYSAQHAAALDLT